MLSKKHRTQLSKRLSYILRHHPASVGIVLDSQGWANVAELLTKMNANGVTITMEMLLEVVALSEKKRFALSDDHTHIRANQGHSLPVELGYIPVAPPNVLYHGTTHKYLDAIFEQGLQKQHRHHVHLSKDAKTAVSVGQRHGKPVLLVIQSNEMYNDGFTFFQSPNGVWLTDYVPSKYIKQIPA